MVSLRSAQISRLMVGLKDMTYMDAESAYAYGGGQWVGYDNVGRYDINLSIFGLILE